MSSDKFGFFCLSAIFSFFESYALFADKNEIIKYTKCPISTHPAKKISLECYACLCFCEHEHDQCQVCVDVPTPPFHFDRGKVRLHVG